MRRRRRRTQPGPGPPPTPTDQRDLGSTARVQAAGPSTEPLNGAAAHRDSTRSRGDGCPPHLPGPNATARHGRRQTHPDRRGGHQPAGRWPGGHQRAGHRTGGQQATGPPDTWTTNPGDRTPDGLGYRTAGPPDPGRRHRMGGHPMPDTARRPMPWLASWQCRPGRRCLTAGCRLDAPPGRRRLGEQQPRRSAAGDTSSWRLGALLSSDDYGSSVEREAHGQVLWRVQMWRLA
jgi:hypothetical protein